MVSGYIPPSGISLPNRQSAKPLDPDPLNQGEVGAFCDNKQNPFPALDAGRQGRQEGLDPTPGRGQVCAIRASNPNAR